VKSYLFPLKVKWRNSIKIGKILKALPKRVQKVIPKNPNLKDPVTKRGETISLN
jgi:hypothetical protein